MIPVVTPQQMQAIDKAAPEPVAELIARAGAAVARAAREMLGGVYGRRVVVITGKGNNGADGRVAARRLAAWGVAVTTIDVHALPEKLPPADLVIDAAFGTGFRGSWTPPALHDAATPVLAVDLPSGLSGLTGQAHGSPLRAERTVTFAAAKPGHLFGAGPDLCGELVVVDIGLDVARSTVGIVTPGDVAAVLPTRGVHAHKWQSAMWLIAGSPDMPGAAQLAARAAMRAGASYVRCTTPGIERLHDGPVEAVAFPVPVAELASRVHADAARFGAVAIGPGLGDDAHVIAQVAAIGNTGVPIVVDGDGLRALHDVVEHTAGVGSPVSMVLTPHEGEFTRLGGELHRDNVPVDRIAAVCSMAVSKHAVVLLKGTSTVVAHPDGRVGVVREGDARLATAGTGDVLTGIIGAFLAQGVEPFAAAWAGAFVHGRAARFAPAFGMIASDLVGHIPAAVASLIDDAPV